MGKTIEQPINKALIIFSDIIDSSVYSSIMGIDQYAKELLKFQKNFIDLANTYFPEINAIKKAAEGDEGIVFFLLENEPEQTPAPLINRAIEFAYMLKATMELVIQSGDDAPKKMHVGTGIHLGDVSTVLKSTEAVGDTNKVDEVEKILGYSINYAKRVESATRIGAYSKIFVSKTASTYLWEFPVVLEKYKHDLKGISSSEDVFEVRSAYFKNLALRYPVENVNNFLHKYVAEPHKLDFISEPWLKGFIISVIDAVAKDVKFVSIQKKYAEKRSELAWRSFSEEDPIILMMRAHDCESKGQHTRRLSILKSVIERWPSFIYAQIEFIEAISKILDDKSIPTELVYARDIARELLEKYGTASAISGREKELKDIIDKINPKLRSHQ